MATKKESAESTKKTLTEQFPNVANEKESETIISEKLFYELIDLHSPFSFVYKERHMMMRGFHFDSWSGQLFLNVVDEYGRWSCNAHSVYRNDEFRDAVENGWLDKSLKNDDSNRLVTQTDMYIKTKEDDLPF